VKDLLTGTVIIRCNSSGPLYPLCQALHHVALNVSLIYLLVDFLKLFSWHKQLVLDFL
jgi:hypothetical protein